MGDYNSLIQEDDKRHKSIRNEGIDQYSKEPRHDWQGLKEIKGNRGKENTIQLIQLKQLWKWVL